MIEFLEKLQPIYLERHSDGLFAEPFNALSNIAFFVAAYFLYRLASRHPQDRRWECRVLPALLVLIGVGSLLFHTARGGYTFLCDVLPIGAFIILVMFSLFRWLTNSARWSIALIAVFLLIQLAIPRGALNGCLPYIVTLMVLVKITPCAFHRCGLKAIPLAWLCMALGSAIAFRAIDLVSSPVFPMGTHWLWHIGTAASAYLAARFVIQETDSRL
ncbi:MAG: hypothetical protein G01um101419_79 [Parcubacteria group bacterium Gr01-1014_19]|nr:MAG: hypothetical protein G01um101419_79 [Parcubacteria group bacterium Gr01-1014_19]